MANEDVVAVRTRRKDPCPCGSGKKYKKCCLESDQRRAQIENDPSYLSALHEAGHAIVAHALGRHVDLLRIGDVTIPVGHSENPLDTPLVSSGFHRAKPHLAEEINRQYDAGHPFTQAQQEWLLTEAVIAWGGVFAESLLESIAVAKEAAQGDFREFGRIAAMLGRVEARDTDTVVSPQFQAAASEAAKTILASLMGDLLRLARALTGRPGEWGEDTIQLMLDGLGSPCGSHRHVLEGLRDRPSDAHSLPPTAREIQLG